MRVKPKFFTILSKEFIFTMNDTAKTKKNQEHLSKPTEKKLKLPLFLELMEDKNLKLERLKECGNFLSFISNSQKTKFRLVSGNFCKNRFCPICSWLKARKNAFEILELLKAIEVKEKLTFIFITLTVPNVPKDKLSDEITNFNKSFKRLFETKEFKAFNKGFIRKLEITYNEERNDYHPHFHLIVAVNKSYFTSRDYMSKRRLLELWQRATRNPAITQVDIKPVKMGSIKEVMEIATYSAKQSELYSSKEVFDGFYEGLYRKKLIVYNGIFKDYRKLQETKQLELNDTGLEEMKEKATEQLSYTWQLKEYQEMFHKILTEEEQEKFYSFDVDVD